MKLKFSSTQPYQLAAIQSVIEVLKGQPLNDKSLIDNQISLSNKELLTNIQTVQKRNLGKTSIDSELSKLTFLDQNNKEQTANFPNLTIEMETGTGKTYTYLRTIYELYQTYGFRKFIIVVPSVAIREGTLKNLELTHEHFQNLYQHPPLTYQVYDSKKLSRLRDFSRATALQILVMNIDSFAKDGNIINQKRERGQRPVDYLRSTKPIVIVDEPQNMETIVRKRAITNLNPAFVLRYSATHRNFYNLIYKLDPVQAYDLGLVKQIEVDGIVAKNNHNIPFIKVEKIKRNNQGLKTVLKIHVNTSVGVKIKRVLCDGGDDLYDLSNQRAIYQDGFMLNTIQAVPTEKIVFANGLTLYVGETQGGITGEVQKFQIERTIQRHFEKEKQYQAKGIKVLSLFFIDKVANYRVYNQNGQTQKGKFAQWFEEIFDKYAAMSAYKGLYNFTASEAHNGYFSQDKKGKLKDTKGNTKADNETYNLIMKDKIALLDPNEPLRFIFSHSALREGWDNPNVFQICTLNETKSALKKRQEIGRGLRLPVDQTGQRIFDKSINILTIIANETYTDFSKQLQREIQAETSVDFKGRIKNAKEKVQIQLNRPLTQKANPLFFALWDKIKYPIIVQSNFDTKTFIKKAVEAVQKMPATIQPSIVASRHQVGFSEKGIESNLLQQTTQNIAPTNIQIPDVYDYIQNKIPLTRTTIFEILKQSNRYSDLAINPQLFLDNLVLNLQKVLQAITNFEYKIDKNKKYSLDIFEPTIKETYSSDVFQVQNTDKTLYNHLRLGKKSEQEFIKNIETNSDVNFYFELPEKITSSLSVNNERIWIVNYNDGRFFIGNQSKDLTTIFVFP